MTDRQKGGLSDRKSKNEPGLCIRMEDKNEEEMVEEWEMRK